MSWGLGEFLDRDKEKSCLSRQLCVYVSVCTCLNVCVCTCVNVCVCEKQRKGEKNFNKILLCDLISYFQNKFCVRVCVCVCVCVCKSHIELLNAKIFLLKLLDAKIYKQLP